MPRLGLLLLLCAVATQADAQTYEETQEFIVSKFSRSWDDGGYGRHSVSVSFTAKCKATFIDDYITENSHQHRENEVDFKDVDPTRVNCKDAIPADIAILTIYGTADEKRIKLSMRGGPGTFFYVQWVSSAEWFFFDRRVGQQLARALSHLATLCGGKAEMF